MNCDICKTSNQVYLIEKITHSDKRQWSEASRNRKYFCNKCKWAFDDKGGNAI